MSNIPNISRARSSLGSSFGKPRLDHSVCPQPESYILGASGSFVVGDSVLVESMGPAIIRFIGATKFRPGVWIGVEFDKDIGKNDGTVQGYF